MLSIGSLGKMACFGAGQIPDNSLLIEPCALLTGPVPSGAAESTRRWGLKSEPMREARFPE